MLARILFSEAAIECSSGRDANRSMVESRFDITHAVDLDSSLYEDRIREEAWPGGIFLAPISLDADAV